MCDLVSVIIPAYNVEKYIRECVYSVLNQTYKDIEIIIVDDGSTDGTSNICDELRRESGNKIIVKHKANEGLGYARNTGMDLASGKYVYFLDSDDFIDSKCIETLYSYIERFEVDTVLGSYYKYHSDGNTTLVKKVEKDQTYYGRTIVEELLPRFFGSLPNSKDTFSMSVTMSLLSLQIIRDNNLREYQFVVLRDIFTEILWAVLPRNMMLVDLKSKRFYINTKFKKLMKLRCQRARDIESIGSILFI